MRYTMAGIILFTQNYNDCVAFYRDILELDLLHTIDREEERLATFSLGDTYLMVENDGVAYDGPKPIEMSPVKFRFNVEDVKTTSDALRAKGVTVNVTGHSWGTTAEFHDPDGNRCALRSDQGFGL